MTKQQPNKSVSIFTDKQALCHACADFICAQATSAIMLRGKFHLVLSGGSTPRALYQLLASDTYREKINWDKVHVWFGDERAVPHDHEDSNFRMASEALLNHVPVPQQHIHAMSPSPKSMNEAATAYENEIHKFVSHNDNGIPAFDLALLGLGPDGHTASLFPGTQALSEEQQLAVPVYVEKMDSWRLTLTYPVFECARKILFLVSGTDKAPIIKQLFHSETSLPAARVQARNNTVWFMDKDAAEGLTS